MNIRKTQDQGGQVYYYEEEEDKPITVSRQNDLDHLAYQIPVVGHFHLYVIARVS